LNRHLDEVVGIDLVAFDDVFVGDLFAGANGSFAPEPVLPSLSLLTRLGDKWPFVQLI
jgi:hypothetical protein